MKRKNPMSRINLRKIQRRVRMLKMQRERDRAKINLRGLDLRNMLEIVSKLVVWLRMKAETYCSNRESKVL